MIGAVINEIPQPIDKILKNSDRVRIITDKDGLNDKLNWENYVVTSKARRKIREFKKGK